MSDERVYTGAYATLRLWSEDLDPLTVTKALLLPPDHTHRAGEPRLKRTKSGEVAGYAPWRHGHWSMSSKAWKQSPHVEEHIEWVLSQVEPKAKQLRELIGDEIEADIFCYSCGQTPQPPSVSADLHERAERLSLVIDIDHYKL